MLHHRFSAICPEGPGPFILSAEAPETPPISSTSRRNYFFAASLVLSHFATQLTLSNFQVEMHLLPRYDGLRR